MDPVGDRSLRPSAFDKMEGLVQEMQDPENGVPVRSQKLFLTSIPSAFMGYDLIEWLMERLGIEESEALNLANQLCQYGYFFPVNDSKNLAVKDDSSLYRFQSPNYWPFQHRPPDQVEYAIYLAKRTMRNKQRHGLEDYELEALGNLRKNLVNKWEYITSHAEEQAKAAKMLKKGEKVVSDSQERAYWRSHRPPPGFVSSLEQCPVPVKNRNGPKLRKKALEDCQREVDMLKRSLSRTRIKVSQALESMVQHVETYTEYDPMITGTLPSNPWVSEDATYWQQNSPFVEVPTEKRVKRWGLSMEELVRDPTGIQEFTNYLRKEYSHENIRFWTAVNDLRRSSQSQIQRKVQDIFEEFLAPGAPCEINIDGKTMERVHHEMKNPTRFTFDAAQDHVYTLLLKKDCYPRFIRSEHYKNLLANGKQPLQRKRFFGFGPAKKKISSTAPPNPAALLQHQTPSGSSVAGALTKRRGSDRSLSGSAHELAVSGVRDTRVPHSHSQSNLSDIPYRAEVADEQQETDTESSSSRRVKKPSIAVIAGASTSEDVCPWEQTEPPRSRKNSIQLDSGSSSSDVSVAIVSDVSDRLRRQCGIQQQFTLDGDNRGRGQSSSRRLSTASYVVDATRRASISAPLPVTTSESSIQPKRAASSSDECPQTETEKDNNNVASSSTQKTFKKSHSLVKTCSVTGANAPIISVSSVADDNYVVIEENKEIKENEKAKIEEPDDNNDDNNENERNEKGKNKMTDVVLVYEELIDEIPSTSGALSTTITSSSKQLAPLAEPDCESPISEVAPETPGDGDGQDAEAKSNDVCPWEDEESCKVDTPFVKTYATLGYL
ncbi:regulator of G-protein signaling 11 isoform X2 [Onthophagus taurus]|uniref:regulator of G-protein signaling 11 isoform X2 n=1 Tax=Onthophagus taurus TaxID=166361 RepID=UPI000C20E14A|nr:regulator of G-protein signaling 11 isoform X2 [Onthophagus taurus]